MATDGDTVVVMIEIISGQNLIIRDKKARSSDPYVKVKLGTKDLHQTKTVTKNLNPIFGEAQNNSFLLECSQKDLLTNGGLLLKVKDYNRLSSDEDMGTVMLPVQDIVNATGDLKPYALIPPSDLPTETKAGTIVVRCAPPTETQLKKFGKKGLLGFVTGAATTATSGLHDMSVKFKEVPQKIHSPFGHKEADTTTAPAASPAPAPAPPESTATPTAEADIPSLVEAEDEPKREKILVEIVGGRDLLVGDVVSSDPYVKAMLGDKEIHTTNYLSKTLRPIYTPEHESTFILDCTAKQLADSSGLKFIVKDYNLIGSDDDLGLVDVDCQTLQSGNGEAMEFRITPPKKKTAKDAGYLLIRCRNATSEDEQVLKSKQKKNLFAITTTEAAHATWGLATKKDTTDTTKPTTEAEKVTDAPPKEAEKVTDAPPKAAAIEVVSKATDTDKAKTGKPQLGEELHLKIEIVSCRGLIIGDRTSSDPYVKVQMGNKDLHKTKHILKTLNPVYSEETNSTFAFHCLATDLFQAGGLQLIVRDWDRIGKNDDLGFALVPAEKLYMESTGADMEFKLTPPKGKEKEDAGYITIRSSLTTADDHSGEKKGSFLGIKAPTIKAPTMAHITTPSALFKPGSDVTDPPKEAEKVTDAPPKASIDVVSKTTDTDGAKTGKPQLGEELHLKIEIVSCRGLIIGDKTSSDPYVKVQMGNKDLHKTKHILKTLNPVYSEETHSTFAFHCLATDLFEADGLQLIVRDWDRIGKNDDLGFALVPAEKLYMESTGADMEFKLTPPKGKENEDAGYITIRSSRTTADDHSGEKKGSFLGIKAPTIKAPTMAQITSPSALFKRGSDGSNEAKEPPKPTFIEICSCRGLLAADKTGLSDPYVKVIMGKKDLHKTKHILQTLDPVFSPAENSFFIMEESPTDVRANGGLIFKIMDWDRIGKNDDLGQATIDAETLYNATGEKIELKISPPKGHGEEAGFITICCRPATETDKVQKQGSISFFKKAVLPSKDYGPPDLSLLVEVVSCWNLPIADLTSSDPYVKVKIGPRLVHQTKQINQNRNPIYTIKTDSLFILDVATKEITENNGVIFQVKDYDLLGRNDELGTVVVPEKTILEASGERLEFQLKDGDKDAGFIAIRCRPATNYDRDFLNHLKAPNKSLDFMGIGGSYKKAMEPSIGSATGGVKKFFTKMVKEENGVKKFRVRPGPDPERPELTEFLSEQQIEQEAYKASKKWLDVGTGDLGKIFVEIIGADGLPNKDTDFGSGNKTDSFVALVYEDVVVQTDVIDDILSPRWLPWTKRAFIFRMMHTSSNLHLAVFDYDPGYAGDHDICGRVSIALANLQPGTEYLLKYNIYENSVDMPRESKGVLILRLRMELVSEKDRILSNLKMPDEIYVNVKTGKDFELVRQTVGGRQDLQRYSTKTIQLYLWRSNTANPWERSKTFVGLVSALVTGRCITGPPTSIAEHQNEEEAKAEEHYRTNRVLKANQEAEARQKAEMKLLAEHEALMSEVGDQQASTDISTGTGGISLDPLKFVLYPIQQYLALACTSLRFLKNVLFWEEPYLAFMLTVVSIALGLVFLFVPWAFLFRWTSRIIAWLLFGPHMWLVDKFWYSKFGDMTEEELHKSIRDNFMNQLEAAKALASAARIQRENAVKLRDIKQALYGDFITKVPVFRLERFADTPLFTSSAKPYKPFPEQKPVTPERIAGQHLVGTMIPKILDKDAVEEAKKEEEKGKGGEAKKND